MSYDEAEHGTVWALENFRAYPGLVVRVRRPGFAALRMLLRADAVLADHVATQAKRLDALHAVYCALADSIDSWTLTRNGRPVPVTRAAVLARDGQMLAAITAAWRRHVLVAKTAPRSAEPAAPAFDDSVLRGLPMEALAGEEGDEPLEGHGEPLAPGTELASA